MVDIRPFRAIRYTEKAGELGDLIAKPYDKISSVLQTEYYKKSRFNYCRLILPLENNKYKAVKQRMEKWLNEGIMSKDKEPAIFVSRQEFELSGRVYARTGLIAAIRLYSYEEGVVFPHEITYKEPKTDRLNILRAIQKDLEPVFLIYSDPNKVTADFFDEVTRTKPLVEIADSFGVKHYLWRITDSCKLKFMQKVMVDKRLVITDGHHRYESALVYRDEMRSKKPWTLDAAFNFHMCYIVPVQEEGLVVLPTHRLLREFELNKGTFKILEDLFTISEIVPTVEALDSFLKTHEKEHAFCLYNGSKAYGLLLKDYTTASKLVKADCPKEACFLDVVILRDIVFKHVLHVDNLKMNEHIIYAESTRHAIETVDRGQAKLAFLVNPVNPEMVWQIAQKNWRLPEKSMDFYPKPVSGLTMMDISPEEKI